jgi:hypothetical protein
LRFTKIFLLEFGSIRTLEHIFSVNGLPFQLRSRSAWEFRFLASKKHLDEAVRMAAGADLVVVSKHPGSPVPEMIQCWFDEWVGLRNQEGVLLSLADEESPSEDLKYFEERARRAGLAFFAHKVESRSSLQGNTASPASDSEWTAFKTVSQTVVSSGGHCWGINEY